MRLKEYLTKNSEKIMAGFSQMIVAGWITTSVIAEIQIDVGYPVEVKWLIPGY